MLSAYEELSDGLAFFEDEGLDANFSRSVVSELTAVKPRPHRSRALAATIAAVAASIALLILPRILFRPSDPDQNSPKQMAAVPSTADDPADDLGAAPSELVVANVEQVHAIWSEWKNRWSANSWKPVDQLEGGFAPITTPLSVAIDELRSTIPLGRTTDPAEDPGDSAGTWIAADLANTA